MIEEPVSRILVYRFQVIHFQEYIQQHFDVARYFIAARVDEHEIVEIELPKFALQRPQAFEQPQCIRVLVDKNPAAKRFAANRKQRPTGEVEINEIALVAYRFQLTV